MVCVRRAGADVEVGAVDKASVCILDLYIMGAMTGAGYGPIGNDDITGCKIGKPETGSTQMVCCIMDHDASIVS